MRITTTNVTLTAVLVGVLAIAPATASARAYVGTSGADTLRGTMGPDRLRGLDGDDTIHAKAGPDRVQGGTGDDRLYGDRGKDRVWAGPGVDFTFGGRGDDRMFAKADDSQVDTIDCGPGNDRATVRSEDVTTNCEHVTVLPDSSEATDA